MKRFAIFLTLLCVGALIFALTQYNREPVVERRTLSEWLENSFAPTVIRADVTNAVRQMGEAAVPVLLEKLRAPDSALKQRLRGSARGKIFPNAWLDSANVQHAQARFGFNILGTQAVVALPQLSNLLFHGREPDRKPYATLQDRVGDALSGIGLPALPLLREALTNSDSRVANGAVRGLIGRGILAREAMTDFIALRHSTNTPMVAMLPSNLAFVCEDCDFVPLALEYLKDERPMVQQFALLPLGRAKTNQSLIFPSVVPFLTNTNWTVRHYASNTLMSLDPAMARNHGVNVQ